MTTRHGTRPDQLIALITGGNRGLGRATAERLARDGTHVIIGARTDTAGARVVSELRDLGLDSDHVVLDVTDPDSLLDVRLTLEDRYDRLDILINNAGILPEATRETAARLVDLPLLRATFETNLFGAAATVETFLPMLQRSRAGRVVNVSSTMGSLSDQSDRESPYYTVIVPAYQMSKAALNGLTVVLAKKLRETPITGVSICPGWVQTDLGGPESRAAAPTTVMEAASFVANAAMGGHDLASGSFVDAQGTVPW